MIKTHNAHNFVREKLSDFFALYASTRLKNIRLDIIYDFIAVNFVMDLGRTLVYVVGCFFVFTGRLQIGSVTAFALYVSSLSNCVEFITIFLKEYRVKMISLGRIATFLDALGEEILDTSVHTALDAFESLRLDNISYCYGNRQALSECSMEILRGESILITGDNGSGKSTLARVLTKLLEPETGTLRYNDVNYANIHPSRLRERLTLIPAEPYLFSGTLADNTFGAPLPEHFLGDASIYSRIDRQGSNLSSGECKLLQLAQGLQRDSDIYIFDEPLNFVDENARHFISDYIREHFADKTVIIITHDPLPWYFCNVRYNMHEGQLIRS